MWQTRQDQSWEGNRHYDHYQNGSQDYNAQEWDQQENSGYRHPREYQQQPSMEMQLELNKPWVNLYLRNQILFKYQLKDTSSNTKDSNDFKKFQEQRTSVDRLTALAKEAFFRQNPGQESFWLPILADEHFQTIPHCDMCEMDFISVQEQLKHEKDHQTCGLDGCKFTANPEQLKTHILYLHASGLHKKMLTGDSPEEINKWRTERQKKYPNVNKTLAAFEKRKKLRELRHKRYLARMDHQKKVLDEREKKKTKRKLDSGETRNKKKRARRQASSINPVTTEPQTSNQEEQKTLSHQTEKSENSNLIAANRSQGRNKNFVFRFPEDDEEDENRNGMLEMFRGTRAYLSSRAEADESDNSASDRNFEISDDEDWLHPDQIKDSKEIPEVQVQASQEIHKQVQVQASQEIHKQVQVQASQEIHKQVQVQASQEIHKQVQVQASQEIHKQVQVQASQDIHKQVQSQGSQEIQEQEQGQGSLAGPSNPDCQNNELPGLQEDSDDEPLEVPVSKDDTFRVKEPPQPFRENPKKPFVGPVRDSQGISKPGPKDAATAPENKVPAPEQAKEAPKFKLVKKSTRPPTLLEYLLEKEINRERSEILQCVRFVCEKNFFGIGCEVNK